MQSTQKHKLVLRFCTFLSLTYIILLLRFVDALFVLFLFLWFISNKFRHLIDSSTKDQRFKTLTLLLSNVIEIEHFTPQWNAAKLNIEYIFTENLAIHVPGKYSLDCN